MRGLPPCIYDNTLCTKLVGFLFLLASHCAG